MTTSRALIVLSLAGCAIACGGSAAPGSGVDAGGPPSAQRPPGPDGAPNDAKPDASSFPCGNAACDASEICLYPAYGCVALAPAEAGVCPDATTYLDASGYCLPQTPAPSCVSPASVSGSVDCSEGATVPGCDVVNPPVPSGCSRVCRYICA